MGIQTAYRGWLVKLALLVWISISFMEYPKDVHASDARQITILPYKNLTSKSGLDWLGEGLALHLTDKFANYTRLNPLSRQQLQYLLSTQQVAELAAADLKQAQRLGKLARSQLIIYGNYQQQGEKLIINTYLVEATQGKIWQSLKSSGVLENILDWQGDIILNLLKMMGIKLTSQQQQALTPKDTTSLAAYESYTKSKLLFIGGKINEALPLCKQALELDQQYMPAVGLLIQLYEAKDQWGNLPDLYQKYEVLLEKRRSWRKLNALYDKIITIYSNTEEFELALKSCNKKLALAKKTGDTVGISSMYSKIGDIYQHKKEPNRAISYFRKVLKLQEKLGNQTIIGLTYVSLGDIYFDKGLYVNALKNYQKGLKTWRLIDDRDAMGTNFYKIGRVFSLQKKYDMALNYFEQAIKLQQQVGNQTKLAHVYGQVGGLHLTQLNYDQAMDYYQKSLYIHEREGNRSDSIPIYDKIGSIHLRRRQFNHALVVYQKMLDAQEKTADPHLFPTYNKIGDIHLAKKNYDLALTYFKKSLETQLITGNKELLSQTYDKLGLIYDKQDNYLQALRYYLKNIELSRISNNKAHQAATYYHIGNIYDKMGKYKKAANYLEKTVQIEKQLNDPNLKNHLDELNQLRQKVAEEQGASE